MKPPSLYSTAVQCYVRCTFNVHNPLDSGVKRKSVNFKTHRTCHTSKCTRPQRTAAAQATRTVCQSVDSHCRTAAHWSGGRLGWVRTSSCHAAHARTHCTSVKSHLTSRHVTSCQESARSLSWHGVTVMVTVARRTVPKTLGLLF